ncbi:GNAT family N-acetyltransferase [Motilimonas pumila]|uniref:N-acetyltransferase n=1 Tax=Motilimonas pumila TaxID=2303987 RepID=A0A418YAL7_9GAMM|nr:GNAT family N-acetyltransferase [Motilimonas pumila]RJG39978.1 N-acetyltransferase [Motilimonas pumila]
MLGNQALETLPVGQPIQLLSQSAQQFQLVCGDVPLAQLQSLNAQQAQLLSLSVSGDLLAQVFEAAFRLLPELQSVVTEQQAFCQPSGYWQKQSEQTWVLWRGAFLQWPKPWLSNDVSSTPHLMQLVNGQYRPMRPAPQTGVLYQRYIPWLDAHLTLVGLSIEQHLDCFHRWQNNQRVAAFWQEQGSKEQHQAYLLKALADDKNQLLIVQLNGEPFAYVEAYWAKEDRIAPYYDAQPYDRGIHMLVGEQHHRGPHKVKAWLASICHYLYLSDPRTQRIVSEPRADNQVMQNYLQQHGFAKLNEFMFPHKKAALMWQQRDAFFQLLALS